MVSTEARPENVAALRMRRPDADVREADVEEGLDRHGRFDVVFCFGLLYHLESPMLGLRHMASVCDHLLLIETIVCDSDLPVLDSMTRPCP